MNDEIILNFINKIKKQYSLDDIFSILINCFLISKIRTEKYNGEEILKNVYPYIFEKIDFNYNSDESVSIINYFSNNKERDIIGRLYENTMSLKNRKDGGSFYTRSNEIIKYMINNIKIDENTKILEPSCGSGLFLIEIIDKIVKNSKEKNKSILIQKKFHTKLLTIKKKL